MKAKNFFNNFISAVFFKNKIKNKGIIDVDSQATRQKQIRQILSHSETKTHQYDYQMTIGRLYSTDEIVFKEQGQAKTIVQKAEKEIEKVRSNFINDFSLKILDNTPIDKLVDVACKSFVGSTDLPSDPLKSMDILQLAYIKSKELKDKNEIEFFRDYFILQSQTTTDEEKTKAREHLKNNKHYIKAKFIFYREIFKLITYFQQMVENITPHEKNFHYEQVFYTMDEASQSGIYEANYFLGIMHLNGYYTKINKQKGFYYICLAASCSHSLAYYELYKM